MLLGSWRQIFTEGRKERKGTEGRVCVGLYLFFASFASFCWILLVSSGKDHSANSNYKSKLMNVDQQTDRHVHQRHVTKQLSLVNW